MTTPFVDSFNQELANDVQEFERQQGGGTSEFHTSGPWSASTTYNYGDVATRCGTDFQSQTGSNVGNDPVLSADWALLGTNLTFWNAGDYLFTTAYAQGSVVLHAGVCYTVLGAGGAAAGQVPGVAGGPWTVYVPPVWSSANAYPKGSFVDQGGQLFVALVTTVASTTPLPAAPSTSNNQWRQPQFAGAPITVT